MKSLKLCLIFLFFPFSLFAQDWVSGSSSSSAAITETTTKYTIEKDTIELAGYVIVTEIEFLTFSSNTANIDTINVGSKRNNISGQIKIFGDYDSDAATVYDSLRITFDGAANPDQGAALFQLGRSVGRFNFASNNYTDYSSPGVFGFTMSYLATVGLEMYASYGTTFLNMSSNLGFTGSDQLRLGYSYPVNITGGKVGIGNDYTAPVWGKLTIADTDSALAIYNSNEKAHSSFADYDTSTIKAYFSSNEPQIAIFDADGNLNVDIDGGNGNIYAAGDYIVNGGKGIIIDAITSTMQLRAYTSRTDSRGAGLLLTSALHASKGVFNLTGGIPATDIDVTDASIIIGTSAFASASTNIDGGPVNITGGSGASGSAGDADGGNVEINGGVGYGTGDHGNVVLAGTRGYARVGSGGSIGIVDGAGDLFVEDEFEVDGTARFDGTVRYYANLIMQTASTTITGNSILEINTDDTNDILIDPNTGGSADVNIGVPGDNDSLFVNAAFALSGNASVVGSVYAIFTVLDDSDVSGDNISAAQAKTGVYITNDGKGGASDYNIPAGVKGMRIYVFAEEAEVIVLDLADSDDIIHLIDGTVLAAGNAIDSDGNAGSSVFLVCHDGDGGTAISHWYVHSQVGTWIDGGAN